MRHSWFKLKKHHYMCKTCGMGRINVAVDGAWVAEWHFPNAAGDIIRQALTPLCELGDKTTGRLINLAEWVLNHPRPFEGGPVLLDEHAMQVNG